MPKLFFKFGEVSSNRLYLITFFMDSKVSIFMIVKGLYHLIASHNRILDIGIIRCTHLMNTLKDTFIGFLWTIWLFYLLHIFRRGNSFLTFAHKIYFLSKLILLLFVIPYTASDLLISFKSNTHLLVIMLVQLLAFNWTRILLDNFKQEKVENVDSISVSLDDKRSTKDEEVNKEDIKDTQPEI